MRFEWADLHFEDADFDFINKVRNGLIEAKVEVVDKDTSPSVNISDVSYKIPELEVYTTRPDTLYGASFLAISADHPLAKMLFSAMRGEYAPYEEFTSNIRAIGTSEEAIAQAPKLGFNTGLRVKHPFIEGATLPVWVANFVLMEYGTGAVFGCPAHDQRDFDFAHKYGLEVKLAFYPHGAEVIEGQSSVHGRSADDFKNSAIKYLGDVDLSLIHI